MTFPIVGRLQDYPQFVLSLMAKRKRDSSCVLMQNFYEARVPENFTVPCDGYMGSTFKQFWVSSAMYLPYVLNFILFYKGLLRKSKRGAAIPHLNKEIFYSLIIGIPPYREQQRISARIDELSQLFK